MDIDRLYTNPMFLRKQKRLEYERDIEYQLNHNLIPSSRFTVASFSSAGDSEEIKRQSNSRLNQTETDKPLNSFEEKLIDRLYRQGIERQKRKDEHLESLRKMQSSEGVRQRITGLKYFPPKSQYDIDCLTKRLHEDGISRKARSQAEAEEHVYGKSRAALFVSKKHEEAIVDRLGRKDVEDQRTKKNLAEKRLLWPIAKTHISTRAWNERIARLNGK